MVMSDVSLILSRSPFAGGSATCHRGTPCLCLPLQFRRATRSPFRIGYRRSPWSTIGARRESTNPDARHGPSRNDRLRSTECRQPARRLPLASPASHLRSDRRRRADTKPNDDLVAATFAGGPMDRFRQFLLWNPVGGPTVLADDAYHDITSVPVRGSSVGKAPSGFSPAFFCSS